ncbi:unnamed protein product [Urochloa humidicola]
MAARAGGKDPIAPRPLRSAPVRSARHPSSRAWPRSTDMAAEDGDKEPNASWQLRHKGRFRKMTSEEKILARMTSKAAGQKKLGASSSKGRHGRRIMAPPDLAAPPPGFENVKPVIAPVKEKTCGKNWLLMFNKGNIAAKAGDLCESLKQWINQAYPPTA